MASSTMVSSSASGGMSSIGGKPSAPASKASRGDGFPLFTFSAVSKTMDSDCTAQATEQEREVEHYIITVFFIMLMTLITRLTPHEGQYLGKTHHHLKISVIHLTLFLALLPAIASSSHTRRLHFVISIIVVFIIFIT